MTGERRGRDDGRGKGTDGRREKEEDGREEGEGRETKEGGGRRRREKLSGRRRPRRRRNSGLNQPLLGMQQDATPENPWCTRGRWRRLLIV